VLYKSNGKLFKTSDTFQYSINRQHPVQIPRVRQPISGVFAVYITHMSKACYESSKEIGTESAVRKRGQGNE
jgi:hypothetical protein